MRKIILYTVLLLILLMGAEYFPIKSLALHGALAAITYLIMLTIVIQIGKYFFDIE